MMNVGNNDAGVRRVVPDVGNDGMSVRDTMVDVRNSCMSICRELCLRWEVSGSRTETVELTLKTRRILSRSDLQVAIVSLSFFVWISRETMFRLPRLTIFFWISATVLRWSPEHKQGIQSA